MEWFLLPWRRIDDFGGRSRRLEYWLFQLLNTVVLAILYGAGMLSLDQNLKAGVLLFSLAAAYYFAILVPSLACSVRRLHDTGRSGWWLLIGAIPLANIALLVFFFLDSDPETNEFGPSPKSAQVPVAETTTAAEPQVALGSAADEPGLTQIQRVVNTFFAPSKTFEDIKRGSKSWWMPFAIVAVAGYLFFAVVETKVGMQQALDNQMKMASETQQERMAQMPPEQRQKMNDMFIYFTEGIFVAVPAITFDVIAIGSLVLLGTINFVFGGKGNYGQIVAVWFYATLPAAIKTLLGILVIFVADTPETFNLKNYAPTNLGAFLPVAETNKALYALATSIDFTTIWSLVLLSIGLATVAGVKRSSGYIAVFGWWAIIVLWGVGWAAVFG